MAGTNSNDNIGINTSKFTMSEFKERIFDELRLIADDDLRKSANITLEMSRVPILGIGDPGIGKTSIVVQAVEEINDYLERQGSDIRFNMKKIQLGQTQVGELQGIPLLDNASPAEFGESLEDYTARVSGKEIKQSGKTAKAIASYAVDSSYDTKKDKQAPNKDFQANIPTKSDRKRVVRVQMEDLPVVEDDGEYGILFLDELTTADEAQVQPALGLADSTRNIGTYKLPEHWLVVAAGNGPDCSNFLRLDNAVITRFYAMDLSVNYETDWRPWARRNGIHSDIIAFLNFEPTALQELQQFFSDLQNNCSPQTACGRTWNNLNSILAQHDALGKPVPQSEVEKISSGAIGSDIARKFASFLHFKTTSDYDVDKIMKGKEKSPAKDVSIKTEVCHLLLQALVQKIQSYLEKQTPIDSYGKFEKEVYEGISHPIRWILELPRPDLVVEGLKQLIHEVPIINQSNILFSAEFANACPEYNKYLMAHAELIPEIVK